MSDFGKKLAAIAVVAAIMFGAFACMSYFKSDIGEDGVKALQALVAGLAVVLANMARSIFVVLLTASLLLGSTSEAQAGPLSRLFGGRLQRSCATCGVRAPVQAKAKPQYRVECRGGVCRRVEVK